VLEGDRLLLYTDGITELRNARREQFGEKRLARFIMEHADADGDDFCDGLISNIRAFAGEEQQDDDIAFLDIKF
jgi:sigma-B regulation protein RsbU (phosphoserine phosphatase)